MTKVLILYHSRLGAVQKMARLIARGVASAENCEAIVRCVPSNEDHEPADAVIQKQDLEACHALVLGSPTRFGNMSAELKYFIAVSYTHLTLPTILLV